MHFYFSSKLLKFKLQESIFYTMFMDVLKSHKNCSHILNIYEKHKNPPKFKGNLYLSGVDALKNPLKDDLGINCVLTIIDEWTFNYYKVKNKVDTNKI